MTTEVKIYRAATMQEALDLVRNELGSEAVILHTRQISQRRLLPWKKSKSEVEITAGVGVNVRSHVAIKQPRAETKKKRAAASASTQPPTQRVVASQAGLSHSASNGPAQSPKNRIGNQPTNPNLQNTKKNETIERIRRSLLGGREQETHKISAR